MLCFIFFKILFSGAIVKLAQIKSEATAGKCIMLVTFVYGIGILKTYYNKILFCCVDSLNSFNRVFQFYN